MQRIKGSDGNTYDVDVQLVRAGGEDQASQVNATTNTGGGSGGTQSGIIPDAGQTGGQQQQQGDLSGGIPLFNGATREQLINGAYIDLWGRNANAGELNYWNSRTDLAGEVLNATIRQAIRTVAAEHPELPLVDRTAAHSFFG